jgi:hypothetical protein
MEAASKSIRTRGKPQPLPGPTSRTTQWLLGPAAARSVDELSFTTRDELGRIDWWNVTPPKTDYWPAHQQLGRAYAFELLDLLNNPRAVDQQRVLSSVLGSIARWLPGVAGTGAEGMADGFFAVVDEYVATGSANR